MLKKGGPYLLQCIPGGNDLMGILGFSVLLREERKKEESMMGHR